MTKKAVVLLSGGLDSATAMAVAMRDGYDVLPMHAQYGQRHCREYESAKALVNHYLDQPIRRRCWPTYLVTINFEIPIQGSALTDYSVDVPLDRSVPDMARDIPVTYVPARNTFLLGLAASLAEQVHADAIFVGFNVLDYSGYPDCRPEYLAAMAKALKMGMKRPVELVAPLIKLSKVEILRMAQTLGVPLEHTWSCYLGNETPCGRCDSCLLRAAAFEEIGIPDPAQAPANG